MKVVRIALAAVLTASPYAFAEDVMLQPPSIAPANYYQNEVTPDGQQLPPSPSDQYLEPELAGDVPPAPVEPAAVPLPAAYSEDCCGDVGCCDTAGCCETCCGLGGLSLFGDCCLGEPWLLKDQLLGECCWLDMGGWTQVGYTSNNDPLSANDNDLLSFNDNPGINLHQQWLWFEKLAEAPCCGWDWGFRFDVLYGIDAQKTQAFGNPGAGTRDSGTWDASLDHGEYGWAMPQAYLQLATGDWDFKIGHFFTPIGYEVIPAPNNFFYTHSFTMYNSEPFTHTGVLGTYSGLENATLYAGWTAGWDTGFDQLNSGSNWLGGFSTSLTDDITFTYLSTYGNFGWRDGGSDDSYSHSVVFDVALSDNLNYVLQSDVVRTDNPGVSNYDTVGINQYLFYTLNDCWKAGTRVEWWKADGLSFNAVTYGLNYQATANLRIRPEVKHNWAPGIDLEETLVGIDAILTY